MIHKGESKQKEDDEEKKEKIKEDDTFRETPSIGK
uniref:Uncharacterized protein n=1 Tax=Caenorhabditis japonica TaxID=281687 RepID=A0A8R1I6V9_CAEJA